MQRSPRSVSSSQSPIDPQDRTREPERVEYRRARQRHSPAPSVRIPQATQAALPSIHNLHLPPPHVLRHAAPAQQYSPSEFLPSASYGSSSFFAGSQRSPALTQAYPPRAPGERRMSFDRPPTSSRPQPSSSAYPEQHASPPEAESEQEQNDSERGPPKKKRRRQALSCTECKRRKIKCDRTHPCGPCARRSEPEKCQWHVIEPVDKYVTRSEYEDLYARYRLLEDRCIRLEKLVLQLHPELTENPPYEISARHLAAMPSPRAPHPISTRPYPLAGPGISGSGSSSGAANPRVTPHTPVSALPGPGPSPRHGPGSAISALPVGSGTRAESSASTRSGSAPPPVLATTVPHPPSLSDRRTSASGLHATFAAPSERSVPHQVPETMRGRPFTAPSPHSFPLPPPPPRPENPPDYSPSRSHSSYMQGRSSAVSETSSIPSPMVYATRLHGRSYPSPLSAVSTSRHMQVDNATPEGVEAEYESLYDRDTRRDRRGGHERSELPRIRDTESKNGVAQASEADDALRHSGSASKSCDARRSFSLRQCSAESDSVPAVSTTSHSNLEYAQSDDTIPPSSRFSSPEPSTSSRKRVHSGSIYRNIPSCGSAPETPQPAVTVH